MGEYEDVYTEVARRFFNQFLELKLSLEREGVLTSAQWEAAERQHQKEIAGWQKANTELRLAAESLASENRMLSGEVEDLTKGKERLQCELNEAIMRAEAMRKRHSLPRDEPGEYPLTEHMSEAAFKEWQKIMAEIPYGGNRG